MGISGAIKTWARMENGSSLIGHTWPLMSFMWLIIPLLFFSKGTLSQEKFKNKARLTSSW